MNIPPYDVPIEIITLEKMSESDVSMNDLAMFVLEKDHGHEVSRFGKILFSYLYTHKCLHEEPGSERVERFTKVMQFMFDVESKKEKYAWDCNKVRGLYENIIFVLLGVLDMEEFI